MISLRELHQLVERFGSDLGAPVRSLSPALTGGETEGPLVLGVVNLSRDSTYRASIAPTVRSAVRRGLVLAAQGSHVVDVGAESTTARAARVSTADQLGIVVPVARSLAGHGVRVSVECYDPEVARAALEAGAVMINYTGRDGEEQVFDLVAEHGATLLLCYVPSGNVRVVSDVDLGDDPVPGLVDHFAARTERAVSRGATDLIIDPGLGFYYGNLTEPMTRLSYQTRLLAQSFRLRTLGFPICQALPHALEIFESDYRQAEAFFAVWASLAEVDVIRTHEVSSVAAVLRGLRELAVQH